MVIQAGYGGAGYVQAGCGGSHLQPQPWGSGDRRTHQAEWPNWQASGQLRDPVSRNKVNGA